MKVIASTDEYTIYQRRDNRYAVKDANRQPVNGDAKVAILLKHELIVAPEPKAPEPEPEEAAAEEAPAEEAAADEGEAEAAEETAAEAAEEPAADDAGEESGDAEEDKA